MHNYVFLGGGSQRLPAIFRVLFETPEIFEGGSIRLVDKSLERAQVIADLIAGCPEYKQINCRILCTDRLEEALDGADVFYLTMAARSEPCWTEAIRAGIEHGYIVSDQLSINGAFLAARLGGVVMDIARKMEKYCPDALMLVFPNPVAAYAAAINNHTRVHALGICGGFSNHRHDLTRILQGRDAYDSGWNVVAAGVNHLSFILRGEYHGQDIMKMMHERLNDGWQGTEITSLPLLARKPAEEGNRKLVEIFRRYGTMIFSSEGDGMAHILWDWGLRQQREQFSPERCNCSLADNYKYLQDAVYSGNEIDWHQSGYHLLGKATGCIEYPIFKALAGIEKMQIVASDLNRGAVAGFPERNVMEYTMEIFRNQITPVANQYIPSPFQGLTGSLAEFHTLLGDAIVTQDGRIFADALEAYPMNKFLPAREAYFRRMFEIFDDLNDNMKSTMDYIL